MSTAHRSLLEVMKTVFEVNFIECSDGHLWYEAYCSDGNGIRPEWTLRFRIPLEDVAGGTFPAKDEKCAYYQRWIRKELLHHAEEQEMIAKAKAEWLDDSEK